MRYKDLQCLDVQANSIRVNTAKDFYIGVSTGELRVTNNLRYNGGDTGYKDIRFANWHAMSSEKFKYDIKEWDYSVLDAFRNDLRLYSYKLNSEKKQTMHVIITELLLNEKYLLNGDMEMVLTVMRSCFGILKLFKN